MVTAAKDIDDTYSSIGDAEDVLFFGDWVKHRRKQLDLTQGELAERACCSVFALRKIEAGERRPSKQLAGMLAAALGVAPADQATFVKVARGEIGVEKLHTPAGESTPAGKPGAASGNLPRSLTPFIGREAELTALAGLLRDPQCSLLTIVGAGGIGKTRLAIEAGKFSGDLFPDGTWFVSLAPLNSPVQVVPTIAEGVGLKLQDPTNPLGQLLRYLQSKKALLVLDNAEHLLEGASVFAEIITDCPKIKMLVTSRERLSLLSEWVFELQGLPVPPNAEVKQFDTASSVALFVQSARRVKSGFDIGDDDRPWVLKICQVMEGMPLGIELSAAWVGLLPVKEIAVEIEKDLDFLTTTLRDIPERQRSMRATLDHSWRLLNPEERLILSRLSVFRGRFSRKSANVICEASLPVLSSLKNKSLLERIDDDNYGLHEIIRQYASVRLAEYPGEDEYIKDRHAMYFVGYLAECEKSLQGAWQIDTYDEMAVIIDDLSLGWQHFVTLCRYGRDNKPFPSVLLFSAFFSLSLFYEMRHRSPEAIKIFSQSVENLNALQHEFKGTDDLLRYNAALGYVTAYLGLHLYYINQVEAAKSYLNTAIDLLGDEGSIVKRAQAMVMLASIMSASGELTKAAEMHEQCREIFRQSGDNWWYALATINLAPSYYSLGRLAGAEELYEEASRLVKPGDLRLRVPLVLNYAAILFLKKDFRRAEQMLLDISPLCSPLHDILWNASIWYYLGRVSFSTQRVELAESYFQKSIDIQLAFGTAYNLGSTYLRLGECIASRGDLETAREHFKRVIRIGKDMDQFHLVCHALVFIAKTYLAEDQTETALEICSLLRPCRVENKIFREEFGQLQSDLQAALPVGQFDAAESPLDGELDQVQARAAILQYAQANWSE